MSSRFHRISAEEISKLIDQGCSCDDWSKVQVAAGFDPSKVKSTHFSGEVKLGVFEKDVSFCGGVKKATGIRNATIHNCTIGNNVYISQVKDYIANYVIEDNVIVENVDLLVVDGPSSFGNGTEVAVINEAGGREISIYDELSAHTAYIMALYRHRAKLIENLQKMIAEYTASVTSSMGLVAKDARLTNCRIIKNVKIGPAAVVEGVNKLENGSINSCPEDPAYIGPGVCAEDFVVCSGSKVTDGTIISKCFVGQGTILAKQYSAENSTFFANCEGLHGEACSIFAGPYTVTHHKSTLLIAGMFSFFNAGSGTNQSNHMYKLGPVHQGITERGCKTGSESYMLWPAKIGAFSVAVGSHYERADTSDFPFSYLLEDNGESILAPASNLRKVGLFRDAKKWPERDRRKSPNKLDLMNFELFSPYTVQKVVKACQLLASHKTASGNKADCFVCPGAKIKASAIEKAIKLYQISIDMFLGDCLIKRLESKPCETFDELRAALSPETNTAAPAEKPYRQHPESLDRWVDLAGLLAPDSVVQKVLGDIEDRTIKTLEQLTEVFRSIHSNLGVYEWNWAMALLQERLGKTTEQTTTEDIARLLTKWKKAVEKFRRLQIADAEKEYTAAVQTGYGIDGDEHTRAADFEAVRGTPEDNSFVRRIEQSVKQDSDRADRLIRQLRKLH